MKKVLAVFLSILMLMSIVPLTAFASVPKDDTIIADLLDGEYSHMTYTQSKNYFDTEIKVYTALGLYKDSWRNFFANSVDIDYAETILLAMIDRFEVEYNNETFEQIISVLKKTKSAAEFVEKADKYIQVLNLAENADWATSMQVLNTTIQLAQYGNELYKQYVESYAVMLSCRAASIYYGEYLQHIIDTVDDVAVKAAAKKLKLNITGSLDEATGMIIAEISSKVVADVLEYGINIAMDSYTVTAIIKKIYNTIGSIGNKVFSTSDKYQYMSSLALITKIEEKTPDFCRELLKVDDDQEAVDFALNALLTLRSTGEEMIINYGKVKEDALAAKVISDKDAASLKANGAVAYAKLGVYRQLIIADVAYGYTYAPLISTDDTKTARVLNADGTVIAVVPAGKTVNVVNDTGAYVAVYNGSVGAYIKVIIPFQAGCSLELVDSTTDNNVSTGKTGIAGFFQNLFDKIIAFFQKLFGKK